mgnify:CR=1 FL=1
MENEFRAICYKNRHSPLPVFLVLFSVVCFAFAMFFDFGRLIDVITPDGMQIGFFPAGSMVTQNVEKQLLSTVQSCNAIAWIAAIVLPSICFRQDSESAAQRMAIAHGQKKWVFELASYFSETVFLQIWYFALNVVLVVFLGAFQQQFLSTAYLCQAVILWIQSALVLQGFFSLNRFVGMAFCSELALASFGFVEVVVGLVISASCKINPSIFSKIILRATPMPHWLALGACNHQWGAVLSYAVFTIVIAEVGILLLVERREMK